MATSSLFFSDPNDGTLKWQERAACRGLPQEMFFDSKRVDEARAVCGLCVVRSECYDYAMTNEGRESSGVDLGVFGGHTYEERRLDQRRWRREQRAKAR